MNKNSMKKLLSLVLCIVLNAAMALLAVGCNDGATEQPSTTGGTTGSASTAPAETGSPTTAADTAGGNVLGDGETVFSVITIDLDGKETVFEVHTDAATVGEALLALGLIDGEQGDFGLYIKSVNGIPLDWDTDGKYWSFYVDGEYALSGVDTTQITPGATYTFKPE